MVKKNKIKKKIKREMGEYPEKWSENQTGITYIKIKGEKPKR